MTAVPAPLLALAARVQSAASSVALFPAVRSLERWLSRDAPIGGDAAAEKERVHFTHTPDFTHPGGDLAAITYAQEGGTLAATVRTTLLGLLGTESPLPERLSEDVLLADDEEALQPFFDVFQHRLLSLLYRSWRRYAPVAAFDGGGDEGLARCLQSLVGIDAFSRYRLPRATVPLFALGLSDLARCEPSFLDTAALEALLERVFPDLQARVIGREPRRVRASAEDLTRLGEAQTTLGLNAAYGQEALDTSGIVRILVGPVSRGLYEALLPGGSRYRALQPLVDEWLAARAQAELEVLISAADAPTLRLGDSFGGALGIDSRRARRDVSWVRMRVLLLADSAAAAPSYHDDLV